MPRSRPGCSPLRSPAMVSVDIMPCPAETYQVSLSGSGRFAPFHRDCSILWVPESSPRLTNGALAAAMAARASPAVLPLILAGSSAGPTTTKSLNMTSVRLMPLPSSTNFFSAAGACTSSTSTSQFLPCSSALPVPTATHLSSMPVSFLKASPRTGKSPVSSVLVVGGHHEGQVLGIGLADDKHGHGQSRHEPAKGFQTHRLLLCFVWPNIINTMAYPISPGKRTPPCRQPGTAQFFLKKI